MLPTFTLLLGNIHTERNKIGTKYFVDGQQNRWKFHKNDQNFVQAYRINILKVLIYIYTLPHSILLSFSFTSPST
jgi:hypothetical protein